MKKTHINNYKFNSIFIRNFITLILATIIPVLLANAIIYNQSIKKIQDEIGNTNMNMLSKTSNSVEIIFRQLEETMQQMAQDPNVINYIINPELNYNSDMSFVSKNSKITRNCVIINNLKNFSSSNNYIHSAFIYSSFNGSILSSDGDAINVSEYNDKEWIDAYKNLVYGTYLLETREIKDYFNNKHKCITLMRNLPFMSSSKLGAIVFNISEKKLYDTISGPEMLNNGSIFVINEDGKILIHSNEDKLNTNLSKYKYINKILNNNKGSFIEEINNEKMIITYVTSSYNKWKYIYLTPLKAIETNVTIIPQIIIVITLIYIILSLFISYLISKGIYNPINDLINIISNTNKSELTINNSSIKNEYDFLGYAYNNVIDENKNMETIIQNARPIIKEKLFTNLIVGKNINEKEISDNLKLIKLNFSLNNFIVVAMQIDGYSEFLNTYNEIDRNFNKIKLIKIIEKIINYKFKGVSIETESDKVAAVINFDNDVTSLQAKEEAIVIASRIKEKVENTLPFTVTLGIGRMYKDILNIKLSYKEAINALKYKLYQGKNEIINIEDVQLQPEELYYYKLEKEKILINNIKIGNKRETELIIDELIEEILNNRNISYPYVQQVFLRVINSIVELIINLGLCVEDIFDYNLYKELGRKETISDIKVWLKEISNNSIDAINITNNSKSHKNAEKIIEYINENINHDISLNDIADLIGFSPAYVSKLFKENIGKSYVDYLNGKRIEKAKQLLKNTQLTVKEIGFRVGFNSIQTFMRTFKKYEGITPGQYRT